MRRYQRVLLGVGAIVVSLSVTAFAEEGTSAADSKLSIHGYLTQAYAATDSHQLIGIPANGTVDYRRLALLFRYAASERDNLVVQIAQRRLGESPLQVFEPAVKVDWAYYEHRFGDATFVRAGRFAIPRGLLSEIRYVGTLLPFYRAPYNFYQEGTFDAETMDGASIRHTLALGKAGSLEATVYGGGYTMLELFNPATVRIVLPGQLSPPTPGGLAASEATAKDVVGGQATLTTPLEGLRFLGGGHSAQLTHTTLSAIGRDHWTHWNVGGEFVRERFTIRSEYAQIHILDTGIAHRSYYVYAGVKLADKLGLNGQFDHSDVDFRLPNGSWFTVPDMYHDWTAGLSYAFRPNLVVKAERHWTRGRLDEDTPVAFRPNVAPVTTNYEILSISAAF